MPHCVPCNTFGEQREIYEWIRLFFKPPWKQKSKICLLHSKTERRIHSKTAIFNRPIQGGLAHQKCYARVQPGHSVSREPFRYESLRILCCWEGPESHSRLHHVQSGALGPTWSCDKRFMTFLLKNMKYYDSANGKKEIFSNSKVVREAPFWNVLFPYGHCPKGGGGVKASQDCLEHFFSMFARLTEWGGV